MLVVEADGSLGFCNAAATAQLGLDLTAGARSWPAIWPDPERAKAAAATSEARAGAVAQFEATCPPSDKSARVWDVTVSPLAAWSRDSAGRPAVLCVARDVTVLRELQARRDLAARLEALGELAGGVAHDFNNLLTIIIGAAEALSEDLEPGSELQDLALVSLRAAECGAGLVRRLLSHADEAMAESGRVDCAAVIAEVRTLAAQLLGPDIMFAAAAPAYPMHCRTDTAELQSALLNLCINARDAMPSGGALALHADCRWLEGADAADLGLPCGSYVAFTVSDTGVGMSPDTLRRAAEPFFTTKGAAGTGLGLSNISAFARKAGGALSIASRPGLGATVQLYLPRAQAEGLAQSKTSLVAFQ